MSGARILFDRAVGAVYTTLAIGRWTAIAIGMIVVISLITAIATGDTNTIIGLVIIFAAIGLLIKMVETIRDSFRG